MFQSLIPARFKRLDLTDDGLSRACNITAKLFGAVLRNGMASAEAVEVYNVLVRNRVSAICPIVVDEEAIQAFEADLEQSIYDRILKYESEDSCIGCWGKGLP